MSTLFVNSRCSISFNASSRLLARKGAPCGGSLSSLMRTILILSLKGRFFSGMNGEPGFPTHNHQILFTFCWRGCGHSLEIPVFIPEQGPGQVPVLANAHVLPMYTATMRFSGRTMTAAENTSELACHTDEGITRQLGAKFLHHFSTLLLYYCWHHRHGRLHTFHDLVLVL